MWCKSRTQAPGSWVGLRVARQLFLAWIDSLSVRSAAHGAIHRLPRPLADQPRREYQLLNACVVGLMGPLCRAHQDLK